MNIGKNVEYEVEGNILTIRCDLTKDFGKSVSGKSSSIASTGGNVAIEGGNGAVLGLNLYRKAAPAE